MKQFVVVVVAVLFALSITSLAVAQQWPPDVMAKIKQYKELADQKKEMPKSIDGVKLITGKELKKWMDQKKSFVLVDNRVKEQYDAERIKGAKWFLADHLMADPKLAEQFKKDDVIVFY